MASEADDSSAIINNDELTTTDTDLIINELRKDYEKLSDKAQTILSEKLLLESEFNQLKKRTNRLDEELRNIKTPPLVVGHIQDLINDNAVVRSSNGSIFLVSVNRMIKSNDLQPGTRVALNQETLSVVEILGDSWDPLVSSAEIIDVPDVTYTSIGGLEDQISELKESIELPFEKPEQFTKFGIKPPKGVLLTGPPGTGKTMLAKAVANSTNATFLGMVGSELAQKYIGEGGRMVRELFELAREKSPSIIFIDEIDSIGSKRLDTATSGDREVQRTLMQLLAEMDGFDTVDDIKIIAATNRPELLDRALLRPGRFDRILEIPLPDYDSRKSIFTVHFHKMPKAKDVDISILAKKTEGFSGAEIKSVVVEAGISAITSDSNKVSLKHFRIAIDKVEANRKQNKNSSPDRLYN